MRSRWIIALAVLALMTFLGVATAAAQEGGDPERGAKLYLENCAMCHGEDAQGRVGARLQAFAGIRPDAAMAQIIAEGISGSVMPAWSQEKGGPLTASDIEDITAYILGVLGGTEPVATAPTFVPQPLPTLADMEGDPGRGAPIFAYNCAACHGERAAGGFGWPLAKSWPGNQPQVYLLEVIAEGIPGTVMPAWSQAEGGPLTEEQIADLAAYILSLNPVQSLPTPAPPPQGLLGPTASAAIVAGMAVVVILGLILYYRKA